MASAYPDPPFDVSAGDYRSGFDIELMRHICTTLDVRLQTIAYTGSNFNGIFDGLARREYDAVISGTTITPDRAQIVLFSQPYLEFGQGVAVNRATHPHVRSVGDLKGLVAGIQQGNTSEIPARKLIADGILASIRFYPYDGILDALGDLEADRIGCIIKLHPVITELVKNRPKLYVPLELPTHEKLGIAFAKDNVRLCEAMNAALGTLTRNGTLEALKQHWITP
ncbi:MAG: ABC transporter substrate-binding protein [Candidatus Aquilonibacter sp.]